MKKFVYLIFSFGEARQPLRLIRAISRLSPAAQVVVHHDPAREPLTPALLASYPSVIPIPDPRRCQWGDFSFLEAMLHSLEWIQENLDFDWVVVLSGQDYPLMKLEPFEARLASSDEDAFVHHFLADDPAHWPAGEGARRYFYRYTKIPRNPYYWRVPKWIKHALGHSRRFVNENIPAIQLLPAHRNRPPLVGFRRLRLPFGEDFRCYGGYWFMDMGRVAVSRVIEFSDERKDMLLYYRHTLIPEESYIQSVLANDKRCRINSTLNRHVHWGSRSHPGSPLFIRCSDLPDLLRCGKPFARKFDLAVDHEVLDRIDDHLGIRNRAA